MQDSRYNRLKVVLAELDVPNKQLAEMLGKTEITISRWSSNKAQPSVEQLFAIANTLDVDVRDLLYSNKQSNNQ